MHWKSFVLSLLVGFSVAVSLVAQQVPQARAPQPQVVQDQIENDDTVTPPAPGTLAYTITSPETLSVGGNFPDAVKIAAKDKQGNGVPDVFIRATIDDGDGQLYDANAAPSATIVAKTGADGVALISLLTKTSTTLVLRVIPLADEDDTVGIAAKVQIVTLAPSSFATGLGSKRSYLQLFVGQTFANSYERETPEATDVKNVGFVNSGPIIRLTFDTMWSRQRPVPDRRSDEQKEIDENRRPAREDNSAHALRYGLWHTDANLEFSRFPFGEEAASTTEENKKGLKDAFSGTLGLTFQPNRFASYDRREDLSEDKQPYDAYRFGLFSKAGVTTRATSEPSGNNSINRIQFGVRFTHARSNNSGPVTEDRNEIPIRFVEMSYARFSEWDGRQDRGRGRLVIDAGLRISALSNAVFPIYVGTHLNTGPGKDDLRVFLGMLVKLDQLGRMVQALSN